MVKGSIRTGRVDIGGTLLRLMAVEKLRGITFVAADGASGLLEGLSRSGVAGMEHLAPNQDGNPVGDHAASNALDSIGARCCEEPARPTVDRGACAMSRRVVRGWVRCVLACLSLVETRHRIEHHKTTYSAAS